MFATKPRIHKCTKLSVHNFKERMRVYLPTAYDKFCTHMYSLFLNTIYQQFISFISINKDTGVVCCRAEIFAITYLPFHCIISFRIFIAGIYKMFFFSDKIHERMKKIENI